MPDRKNKRSLEKIYTWLCKLQPIKEKIDIIALMYCRLIVSYIENTRYKHSYWN